MHSQLPFARPSGIPEAQQLASAAASLSGLPPPDQELLLLFSALVRHIAKASRGGAGYQDQLAHICR